MPSKIYSFGYRHGLTVDDQVVFAPTTERRAVQHFNDAIVIDIRKLLPKNPYHNKKLRALRGDDEEVIAELESTPGMHQAYHELRQTVRAHHGRVYIGCTGGHHRSVYIANRLAKDFDVPVEHLNYEDR